MSTAARFCPGRATILTVGLALSWGCISGLDEEWEVKDLRVLAIQADPPEVMYTAGVDPASGAPAFLPSADRITFRALVADPRGGELAYEWSLCPIESDNACADFDEELAAARAEARPVLEAARAITSTGTAIFETDPGTGLVPFATTPFVVDPSTELFFYHLSTTGLGAGFGSWPSVGLTVETNGETLTAQKRFVISLAPETMKLLPSFAEAMGFDLEAAESFGLSFCPPGQTPAQVPDCLYLEDRPPNANPVFGEILIANGPSANATWQSFVEPVLLAQGQEVRLLPTFTRESFEAYQILEADLDTRVIHLKKMTEDIAVSWFATAGALADSLTWPKFTLTRDTVFSAPHEIPSSTNGRVTLWLVARDQRGGAAWRSVEIRIVNPVEASGYWRNPARPQRY